MCQSVDESRCSVLHRNESTKIKQVIVSSRCEQVPSRLKAEVRARNYGVSPEPLIITKVSQRKVHARCMLSVVGRPWRFLANFSRHGSTSQPNEQTNDRTRSAIHLSFTLCSRIQWRPVRHKLTAFYANSQQEESRTRVFVRIRPIASVIYFGDVTAVLRVYAVHRIDASDLSEPQAGSRKRYRRSENLLPAGMADRGLAKSGNFPSPTPHHWGRLLQAREG